jgi:integrase
MPTEADTCRTDVVPRLQAAGWDDEPHSIAEQRTITDGRIVPIGKGFIRRAPKRVDYLLRYTTDFPLAVVEAILHRALRKAVKDRLIPPNVAADLDGKPRRERTPDDARQHAWTAAEASAFLKVVKAAGTQPAAFYSLALDSGSRKSELGGLRWSDVDLEAGKIRIVQQLTKPGPNPTFGPTKTGKARTITLDSTTVDLLRAHKKAQAALKMRNRTAYHDHGLVFAKEWADVRKRGGNPRTTAAAE